MSTMEYLRNFDGYFFFVVPIIALEVFGARDQFGKQFLIFHAHSSNSNISCALEVHVVTDRADGALVDMSTPRLTLEEGGFRQSVTLRHHESAVLCARQPVSVPLMTAKRDNAVLLQSNGEVAVLVVTSTPTTEREMHVLYPTDVLGTVYHFMAPSNNSILIVISPDANTDVDILFFFDSRTNQQNATGEYHYNHRLERYEALVFCNETRRAVNPEAVITSSKPVVVMTEIFQPSVSVNDENITGYSYAQYQLIPKENWDKEFYFRLPMNPGVTALTLMIKVDLSTKNVKVHLSQPSGRSQDFTISSSQRSLAVELKPSPREVRCVELTVSEPATATLLVYTSRNERDAFSVAKIPPQIQWFNLYVFSVSLEHQWTTILHVIARSDDLVDLLLQSVDGSSVPFLNFAGTKGGLAAKQSALGRGTYILTHASPTVRFSAYLESFIHGRPATMFTELGMRFAPVNRDCVVTTMEPDDTLDNDCNGQIDEDGSPTDDADNDGLEGEDVVAARVNGGLGEWGEWECSSDCSTGVLVSKRLCTNPPPSRGGRGCDIKEKSNGVPCSQSPTLCLQDCPVVGWWGLHCTKACPLHCLRGACSRYEGECRGGCRSGRYGPRCRVPCHLGYGGKNCSVRCFKLCPSRECHPVTLRCTADRGNIVAMGVGIAYAVIFVVPPILGSLLYLLAALAESERASWFKQNRHVILIDPDNEMYTEGKGWQHYGDTDKKGDGESEKDDDSSSSSSSISWPGTSQTTPVSKISRATKSEAKVITKPSTEFPKRRLGLRDAIRLVRVFGPTNKKDSEKS